LSDLLGDFVREYDFQWQAGINRRSVGYVVLFRDVIRPNGWGSEPCMEGLDAFLETKNVTLGVQA
jgi:hypothetical protein